jgi:hypothetical protein
MVGAGRCEIGGYGVCVKCTCGYTFGDFRLRLQSPLGPSPFGLRARVAEKEMV